MILLCGAPAGAHAAGGGEGGGMMESMMQMTASLAIVLGIIYLLYYLVSRKFRLGLPGGARASRIRVIENRFLAPKKSLMLVEVNGEYLLLGNTNEGLTLIKQIDMLEEIEVIGEARPDRCAEGGFQQKLGGVRARLQGDGGAEALFRKMGVLPS
jgi:flagellar protein FliO/FliZ